MISSQFRITSFQDLHTTRQFYRRFVSSLSEPIRELVICSPYFDKLPDPFQDVVAFCTLQQSRGVESIRIVTRPPGKDPNAMSMDTAKRLVSNEVDLFVRASPYLHAKLYHLEYQRGFFRTFVGSSNFTLGGFRRNDELVAELEGVGNNTPCHREIERLFARGAMSYYAWIASQMPVGEEESK